jgi:Tol biopolymer transport system component
MSPEQALGRDLDARTDLFSFGVVLYEMATGRQAFSGATSAAIFDGILHHAPASAVRLNPECPAELERIINKALEKDRDLRFQSAAEIRADLKRLKRDTDSGRSSVGTGVVPTAPPPSAGPAPAGHPRGLPPRRLWPAALAAVVFVAVGLGVAGWLWRNHQAARQPEPPMREVPLTGDPDSEATPSFSPDGLEVVFTADTPGHLRFNLLLKQIGAGAARELFNCGDEFCAYPAWSPDGQWIAFGRWKGEEWGTQQKVPILLIPRVGGAERKIAETYEPAFPDKSFSWTPDSKWLVTTDKDSPEAAFYVVLVSCETGEKRRLTTPPSGTFGDTGPAVSPDGRTLAFTRHVVWGASDLYLLNLSEDLMPLGKPRKLTSGVANANFPVWTPDGTEIVFCSHVWHDATMWRIRADGSGKATPLSLGGRGAYFPAIAPRGNRLVYAKHIWNTNIWRVQMQGAAKAAGPAKPFIQSKLLDLGPAYSPDGKRIAFASDRSGSIQIWVCNSDGTNLRQLTSMNSTWGMIPVWSPDGEWIAFWSDQEGNRQIYVINAQGGAPRRLTTHPANDQHPVWSHDGQWIFFNSDRTGEWKVWKVRRDGGDAVLTEKPTLGQEDPDGRFLYFVKDTEGGPSLWRRPVEGGGEIKVLDSMAREDFQVARQGIYYIARRAGQGLTQRWSLAWHDLASGKETDIVPVSFGMGNGLALSPDGRFVLYTQQDRESTDLMLVENFH